MGEVCMMEKKIWVLICSSLLFFGACEVNLPITGELWSIEKPTKLGVRSISDSQVVRSNEGDVEYIIATWRDLEYISENFTSNEDLLGYNYIVVADITFPDRNSAPSDEDGSYAKEGFLPIGTEELPFSGTFDGRKNIIENLVIDRGEENFVGLFGYVEGIPEDESVKIANVYLREIRVTGKDKVGGLVGSIGGNTKVSNSYATGQINGRDTVGGLVGSLIGAADSTTEVSNSYATGQINGRNTVGGLVGSLIGDADSITEISNSYATGEVDGEIRVGGLVGGLLGADNGVTKVSNSYAIGEVNGTTNVGGLVGSLIGAADSTTEISSSYATGYVHGRDSVGGLVGVDNLATTSNNYATGKVHGVNHVGGFIGLSIESTVEHNYATGKVIGNTTWGRFIGRRNGETVDISTNRVKNQETGDFMSVRLGGDSIEDEFLASKKEITRMVYGWDFDGESSVWHWRDDGEWPILKWELET